MEKYREGLFLYVGMWPKSGVPVGWSGEHKGEIHEFQFQGVFEGGELVRGGPAFIRSPSSADLCLYFWNRISLNLKLLIGLAG